MTDDPGTDDPDPDPGTEVQDGSDDADSVLRAIARARPEPAPVAIIPGTRLGPYEVQGLLGRGGMGVVYRAVDTRLGRELALKIVRAPLDGVSRRRRFLREARAAASAQHPNVATVYEVGEAGDLLYIAMELIAGTNLRVRLAAGAPGGAEGVRIALEIARALASAHARGVIHRDLKPENVMITPDGGVKLVDFGLAKLRDPFDPAAPGTATREGAVMGTPGHMAPEQMAGKPTDARTDVYAFGIVLHELLAGAPPSLLGDGAAVADPQLAAIVRRCIASSPEARWADGGALVAAFAAWPGAPRRPTRRRMVTPAAFAAISARRRPRRWSWRLAAGLAASAVAVAVVARWQSAPSEATPARLVQLTQRADLKNAALSPDGRKLALVVGDSLVIRGVDREAEDRVLVEHGIDETSIAWSPDGKRLLVAIVPEVVGTIQTELVDLEHGAMYQLPAAGMAAFLSSSEVAVASHRQRFIEILPLRERAATVARCDVPGDYTYVWSLHAMSDGSMIVRTQNAETGTLVLLARDCRVLGTFSAPRLAGVAVSERETAIALVQGDGFGEIVELSRAGAVMSRRRVIGELSDIIGRHHGVDYLLTVAGRTHLVRVHGTAPPVPQFSSTGASTFALAPDGHTLAWIELGGINRPRGPLRLSTLDGLARQGRPLLDNAVMTSWSPDGGSLATLVDDESGVAVVVVDRAGGATRRLPLQHLDPTSQPVWLDDHRVAAQTDDLTTYLWLDLWTGEQGELVDRDHGPTAWLARSPRDGTLAMWRSGNPGGGDAAADHLWLVRPGHEAAFVHVADAARYHLMPSWSSGGELLVQALETGAISRVARDTGELTRITQLAPISLTTGYADHLMTLSDGDLLATQTELGINVSLVRTE